MCNLVTFFYEMKFLGQSWKAPNSCKNSANKRIGLEMLMLFTLIKADEIQWCHPVLHLWAFILRNDVTAKFFRSVGPIHKKTDMWSNK